MKQKLNFIIAALFLQLQTSAQVNNPPKYTSINTNNTYADSPATPVITHTAAPQKHKKKSASLKRAKKVNDTTISGQK